MDINLNNLYVNRQLRDERKAAADEAKAVAEASAAWANYQEKLQWYREQAAFVDGMENEIRSIVIHDYDGDKHPYPGVEIKTFTVITVTDQKAAVKWAGENAPACVKLDEVKFKKVAEALDLPFVSKSTENRVQIASDLSYYLKESSNEEPDKSTRD